MELKIYNCNIVFHKVLLSDHKLNYDIDIEKVFSTEVDLIKDYFRDKVSIYNSSLTLEENINKHISFFTTVVLKNIIGCDTYGLIKYKILNPKEIKEVKPKVSTEFTLYKNNDGYLVEFYFIYSIENGKSFKIKFDITFNTDIILDNRNIEFIEDNIDISNLKLNNILIKLIKSINKYVDIKKETISKASIKEDNISSYICKGRYGFYVYNFIVFFKDNKLVYTVEKKYRDEKIITTYYFNVRDLLDKRELIIESIKVSNNY